MNILLRNLQIQTLFILKNAQKFKWSLQGMGFFRLYMGNTRLHVWDQTYANPGVSMIHDHAQWALRSTIIAGHLVNQRYVEHPLGGMDYDKTFNVVRLRAGFGCKFMGEPQVTYLKACRPEHYMDGDIYSQQPHEIHETKPDGVVITMMEKSPTDTDTARVFWPFGEEWGSAEPREANAEQINNMANKAIDLLERGLGD